MNLEDIAKKAGVSRSTVSRVINGEPYVSEKTRKKVLEVIEEVGFSPNPAARMLVTQRANVIGVVMPHPVQDLFASDNPYYHATLLQGISDVVRDRGYAMLLWLSHPEEETQVFYRRILSNRLMDGLLIIATLTTERGLIDGLLESKTPFVLASRPIEHEDKISYVTMDNIWAAQHAVQHLINLGRRHIATITGDMDNVDAQDRFLGYQKALRGAGIPIDENLIAYGLFNSQRGYNCMKQILHRGQKIDAVFAHSDIIAIGALRALHEAGLQVPDDVAVVGFDDIPAAQQTTPPLTTVRHPILQKGAQATSLLLDLVEGYVERPTQILLQTQLVIRQSCGSSLG